MDFLVEHREIVRSIWLAFRQDGGLLTGCELFPVSSWEELSDRAEHGEFDVAIVQPSFPEERNQPLAGMTQLSRLRKRLGSGRLIPFVRKSPDISTQLRDVGAMGFPIVLIDGMDDDPRSLLRAVARARTLALADSMRLENDVLLDPARLDLAVAVLAGWPPPESVGDLAAHHHLVPETLRNRLRARDLPTPVHLVRWGRLVEGLCLGRMGVPCMDRIAFLLQIGGRSSLARLSKSLTGRTFTSVLKGTQEREVISRLLKEFAG